MTAEPKAAGEAQSGAFPFVPLTVFAAATLCIAIGGWHYHEYLHTAAHRSASDAIEAVASLKVRQIDAWRRERLNDARILSANLANADRIRSFLEDPSPADRGEDIARFMQLFIDNLGYRSAVLTDPDGVVRLSVGPDEPTVGAYGLALIREVTRTGRSLLSDFHRAPNVPTAHLDLCVPILVPGGEDDRCVGTYLLRIEPERFLYPTLQDWPTPSPTAETLLVRREGEDVLFLNELRHRRDAAMTLRRSVQDPELPAAAAVRGHVGSLEGRDYRGVPVMAATRAVPETPWFIVAKVDEEEAYGPLHRRTKWMGAAIAGLVLLAGLATALWWREREARLLRRHLDSERQNRILQELYADERARRATSLRAALEEKITLLKEVHHRVKNNMQVISSMLSLQAAGIADPGAATALRETQNRIRSMALLHETLYRSENLARVDVPAYLNDLCAHLFRAHGVAAARIRLTLDADRSSLSLDQAIPCGLIVNELVSNCLKHAFPGGRAGEVRVTFRAEEGGGRLLSVRDDGVGMAAGKETGASATLGLRLVNGLAAQLKGTVEWQHESGVVCRVRFREAS